MSETEKIKFALERSVKALSLKPSLGQGTGVSKTRIKNGLTCEIQEGSWKFLADMPESVGGNAQGPAPGVYGRAALCALGLMYAPDPVKVLKGMYRVIKPGGRTVAAVWGQRDHCGWAGVFEIVDKRVSSEVCSMFFNLFHANCFDTPKTTIQKSFQIRV